MTDLIVPPGVWALTADATLPEPKRRKRGFWDGDFRALSKHKARPEAPTEVVGLLMAEIPHETPTDVEILAQMADIIVAQKQKEPGYLAFLQDHPKVKVDFEVYYVVHPDEVAKLPKGRWDTLVAACKELGVLLEEDESPLDPDTARNGSSH